MHSIADVFLRENGTEQRRGSRRDGGVEKRRGRKRRARRRVPQSGIVVGRKSIRPEASYLKVCIEPGKGKGAEKTDVSASESERLRRAAKLSVKSSRARKKCERFSNLSVTILEWEKKKEKKWGMNRALMKSHSPIHLARLFLRRDALHSSRNLLTRKPEEFARSDAFAIIESVLLSRGPTSTFIISRDRRKKKTRRYTPIDSLR